MPWVNFQTARLNSMYVHCTGIPHIIHDICVKQKIISKIREKLEEHFDIENRNFGKFWEHNFHTIQ